METQDQNWNKEDMWKQWEADHRRGKVVGGIFVVIIGALFLSRSLGAELPHWLFSWKFLLIGIGLFIGIKHRFRNWGWLFPVAIGGVFLAADVFPDVINKPVLWPLLIILAGLIMIFKPRRSHRHWRKWHRRRYGRDYNCMGSCEQDTATNEDRLATDVVFGSTKKSFISKDFKGGEISVVFGGAELNLTQADINGSATLEISVVFGGTELIIPANWKIKSEMTTVMGSVEDKRPLLQYTGSEPEKILILRGSVVLGGIEIKSY
jgi:predicted membrane protein